MGHKDSDDSCQSSAAVHGDQEIEMAGDEENIDINIQQTKTVDENNIDFNKVKFINNENYTATDSENNTATDSDKQSVDQNEGEVTEITLTTDSDGRYIITTQQNMTEGQSQCIAMPESKEFEDSMYNLQMLGEVALKNQTECDIANL